MRRALAIAAPLLALGLLAGCDLPGGSAPRSLLPDQMPNNSAEEAPTIDLPALVHGSLDSFDQHDFFAPRPPLQNVGLYVTCTGDVEVGAGLRGGTDEQSAQEIVSCDGEEHFLGVYDPEDNPVVAVLPVGDGFAPYVLTLRYGPTGF
jgi:hypothetical protein